MLPRIQRRQRQVTGCPESTTASTEAAAGDRASTETTLQRMAGATSECSRLLTVF